MREGQESVCLSLSAAPPTVELARKRYYLTWPVLWHWV